MFGGSCLAPVCPGTSTQCQGRDIPAPMLLNRVLPGVRMYLHFWLCKLMFPGSREARECQGTGTGLRHHMQDGFGFATFRAISQGFVWRRRKERGAGSGTGAEQFLCLAAGDRGSRQRPPRPPRHG